MRKIKLDVKTLIVLLVNSTFVFVLLYLGFLQIEGKLLEIAQSEAILLVPITLFTTLSKYALIALIVLSGVEAIFKFLTTSIRLDDEKIKYTTGFLLRRDIYIPLNKLQQIEINVNPILKVMGLSSLRLTTRYTDIKTVPFNAVECRAFVKDMIKRGNSNES